jgi:hypothetical protein
VREENGSNAPGSSPRFDDTGRADAVAQTYAIEQMTSHGARRSEKILQCECTRRGNRRFRKFRRRHGLPPKLNASG